ncbi:MAG: tetratricopeptide repeat protein [Gammaproteobacteria bacterium]|nr:tetratricopeptide repeat protein [Gammaproteobacteria bacterium]MDH3370355.1 tetratricopeptide repeat protein [Gammaproteobacteria bacterium]MDH3405345.1 tetratricopeptide repeat protein [Gammaproteobacteria bacterium]MDH3561806.1 tetratricopeptide repeat protein [Gammaproteobacteria bacterium]MDH5485919.1 tetratricopeptide repeat protein [Gammaproteobacteria bacterium]
MTTQAARFLSTLSIVLWMTACASVVKTAPPADSAPTKPVKIDESLPSVELTTDILYDLLLGEIAGQQGKIGVAAATLGKVARETRDPRIAERATLASLYAKRYEEAHQSARLWIELRPHETEAREALITALLELDRVEEAREHFETLFSSEETRRNLDQAYLRVAAVLGRSSNRSAAIDLMRSLVALNPTLPSAHFSMAHLMVRGGELDRALVSADEALKYRPNWEEAALFKARILLSLKEPQKARAFYESFLNDNRDANVVRLNYARFLVDQKEWEKALEEFKRVAASVPDDADTVYAVGLLSLQNNRLEEAEKYLKRALALRPQNDQARLYLGQVAEQRKQFDKAVDWYLTVKEGEYFFEAQTRLGVALAKQGDLDRARQHLDGVKVQTDPQRVQIALAHEQILRDARKFNEALAVLNEAVKTVPGDKDLLYARALVAEKLNKLDITERDLREILKKDPTNVNALNALGYTLTDRTTRYDEAHELLQQAISLKPDDAFIMDSMGWLQYRLGNSKEALKYLRRALEIRNDAEIAAHLGEVLWVTGDRHEAESVWNRALRETPNNESLNGIIKKFKP